MVLHFGSNNYRDVYNHDLVLYITGHKLLCEEQCANTTKGNGIAFLNGTCDNRPGKTYGVAIVKDNAAYHGVDTAAHEIGPLLGMKHDGDDNCCCSDDGYIMADSWSQKNQKRKNAYKWSSCSLKSFQVFVTSHNALCLHNKPIYSPFPLMDWEDLIAPSVPSVAEQCSHIVHSGTLIASFNFFYHFKHSLGPSQLRIFGGKDQTQAQNLFLKKIRLYLANYGWIK